MKKEKLTLCFLKLNTLSTVFRLDSGSKSQIIVISITTWVNQKPLRNAEAVVLVTHHLVHPCEPNTACLEFARQQWGISRAQGYKLLKRAWAQIKADVDKTGIDRQEMLAWSIQTLMAAAGQAMEQKNPGAVVSCVCQLDWMTGLGVNSTIGHRTRF